ncbi:MAG: hypothetical protein WBE40_00540 [Thermoplasmata archaeon]
MDVEDHQTLWDRLGGDDPLEEILVAPARKSDDPMLGRLANMDHSATKPTSATPKS